MTALSTKRPATVFGFGTESQRKREAALLPFARAVDIDAGVNPEWMGVSQRQRQKADAWSKARDALFDVSKWDTNGVLFVHYGAKYGVSGLRVSDYNNEVVVSPADPTRFMLIYEDMYSSKPTMALWIENRKDEKTAKPTNTPRSSRPRLSPRFETGSFCLRNR